MRTPTARAAGITELEIVVDSHELYAYRFGGRTQPSPSRATGLTVPDRGKLRSDIWDTWRTAHDRWPTFLLRTCP